MENAPQAAGREHASGWRNVNSAEGIAEVRQHLARILESPSFQGSKRCQEFLRYVVDRALAGQFVALKERVIGAEVFGRQSSYDTSSDAIVRVKANEVRKRLAQYYQDSGGAENLRIELPAGSYVPTLSRLEATNGTAISEAAAPAAAGTRAKWPVWTIAGLAVMLAAAAGVWRTFPSRSPLERFWAPVLASTEPVVVCMSVRDDYLYSPRVAEALAGVAQALNLQLNMALQRDDVVRVPNGQMSLQSLKAILELAVFLTRHGKQTQFRTPAEVSFDEIRHRGMVLVGSFYNPWALQLTQELRYRFEFVNHGTRAISWIRDSKAPGERKWMVDKVWPYFAQPADYAIISRVFEPSNQRVTVAAAGMSRFGAQVAGEFLTTPRYWNAVAEQAPRGWERMNCQIVLETKVIGTTPGPPKIAAVHFW